MHVIAVGFSPLAQVPNLANWYHLGGGGGERFVMLFWLHICL